MMDGVPPPAHLRTNQRPAIFINDLIQEMRFQKHDELLFNKIICHIKILRFLANGINVDTLSEGGGA
jgi:hypothetical protein